MNFVIKKIEVLCNLDRPERPQTNFRYRIEMEDSGQPPTPTRFVVELSGPLSKFDALVWAKATETSFNPETLLADIAQL